MHVTLNREGDFVRVNIDSPPVNALSSSVRSDLIMALREAEATNALGVIISASGHVFIGGADINEFESGMAKPDMHDLVETVSSLTKLTIIAIQGAAMGGGLEVCLACDLRIASSNSVFSFPEVSLGLLAAAGGTQRLTRVVGPEVALRMLALGDKLDAAAALKAGLVDALSSSGNLWADAARLAERAINENNIPRKASERTGKIADPARLSAIIAQFRKDNVRKLKGRLAADLNIRAVEGALSGSFEAGRQLEKELLDTALKSDQVPALRYAFFSRAQSQKIAGVSGAAAPIKVGRVGVVGAGTMGRGIAMACANAGLPVVLSEQTGDALQRGVGSIQASYDRSLNRGDISEAEYSLRRQRIQGHVGLDILEDVDFVIEAAFERMDVKRSIFATLDLVCREGTILGTNTSGLDIDEIAATTRRAGDVIGLHFGSPAHATQGVEVIRGASTSLVTIASTMKFAKQIGKIPILVGNTPGFVANRTMYPYRHAAISLVAEGAMPCDVDRVVTDFGFPMGPFAMHDLAGLDVGWVRGANTGDALRDRLCEMGRFGQKTGAGYYNYEGRTPVPSADVVHAIDAFRSELGAVQQRRSDTEMLERLLFPIANEAAEILREGKALRASDIDMMWRLGYGWPDYEGGPAYYADKRGLGHVASQLASWSGVTGKGVSPLLQRAATNGDLLHKWGWIE